MLRGAAQCGTAAKNGSAWARANFCPRLGMPLLLGGSVLTRLEALKAALRAAVRDGETNVAKQLTKAVIAEMNLKTSPNGGLFYLDQKRSR